MGMYTAHRIIERAKETDSRLSFQEPVPNHAVPRGLLLLSSGMQNLKAAAAIGQECQVAWQPGADTQNWSTGC